MPNRETHFPTITIFTHEFFPKRGGISTYIQEMALAAHTLGYPVKVFAPTHSRIPSSEFPYEVIQLPCVGTQNWRCRISTANQMLQNRKVLRNSILYLPEPAPLRLMMYLRLLHLIQPEKIILTLHGTEIRVLSAFFYRRYLFKKLVEVSDRITVLSEYSRHLLVERFPNSKSKVCITPGALRSDFTFYPGQTRKSKTQEFIILTVGRIHPRKGHLRILRALSALDPIIRQRITYQMAGPVVDSHYFKSLQKFIAKNQIRALFLGEIEDDKLTDVYKGADLFAMTSVPHHHSTEGFGLVYLEAMAHGLPILAHDIGGVKEVVQHGINGILIDPKNESALVQALQQLVEDENLRNSLRNTNGNWIKKFSWAANVRSTFEPSSGF